MITSTKNSRIVQARKLTQRKHRLRQNRFLVEGLQLLGLAVEAMAAGQARLIPGELFYSEELFAGEMAPRLLAALRRAGAEPVPVAAHVLDTLSQRDVSQGLAATFALRELEDSPAEIVRRAESDLLLILDRLQDPGNLGTLIRTADAVGAGGVILLEPSVDPFDPKTVRGTMGSIFTIPFARSDDIAGTLAGLGRFRPVGADANLGRLPWQNDLLKGAVALVLGNEARGLGPELSPYLADYAALPLRGQAESLNVAIAGGVLMYEWLRVNTPTDSGTG